MTTHVFASSQSLRWRVEGYSERLHSGCSSHLENAQLHMGAPTQRGKSVRDIAFFTLLLFSSPYNYPSFQSGEFYRREGLAAVTGRRGKIAPSVMNC